MSEEQRSTETREVSGFDRVSLRSLGDMTIVQGERESLTIEADADLLPKIKTTVEGGRLIIDIGRDWWERLTTAFLSFDSDIKYQLSVRELRGMSLAGAGSIRAERLTSDRLKVSTSGAAKVEIGSLTVQSLDVAISGRGEFEASGTATDQEADISGLGEYRAGNLAGETVEVSISGHGRATVRASRSLEVNISGMGTVEYYGNPALSQRVSGMGTIRRLEDA